MLGYAKPENAFSNHVDGEDKTTTLVQGTGSNYKSKAVLINESSLYSLILSSKMPDAKKFKHWVTSEVLPSIRKNGAYLTDKTALRYQPPPHKTYIPPFSIVNGGRRNIIPRTSPINTVFKAFYCETV